MKMNFNFSEETKHLLWGIVIGIIMGAGVYCLCKFYRVPQLSDANGVTWHDRVL